MRMPRRRAASRRRAPAARGPGRGPARPAPPEGRSGRGAAAGAGRRGRAMRDAADAVPAPPAARPGSIGGRSLCGKRAGAASSPVSRIALGLGGRAQPRTRLYQVSFSVRWPRMPADDRGRRARASSRHRGGADIRLASPRPSAHRRRAAPAARPPVAGARGRPLSRPRRAAAPAASRCPRAAISPAGVDEEDDIRLQPLGAVHRHHPHAARALLRLALDVGLAGPRCATKP